MDRGLNKKVLVAGIVLACLHFAYFIFAEFSCQSFGCIILFVINPITIPIDMASRYISIYGPQSPITFFISEVIFVAIVIWIFYAIAKRTGKPEIPS